MECIGRDGPLQAWHDLQRWNLMGIAAISSADAMLSQPIDAVQLPCLSMLWRQPCRVRLNFIHDHGTQNSSLGVNWISQRFLDTF